MLGDDARGCFKEFYDVTPGGNWEEHNILNRLRASRAGRTPRPKPRWRDAVTALFAVRAPRVRPGLDDKVLADWNGLMIAALAQAGLVFERAGLAGARRARLRLCRDRMAAPDGRLVP